MTYGYNAWGRIVDESAESGNVAALWFLEYNALKYRGYYYDADLGLYYLNSRYYDPVIGRFINADDIDIVLVLPTSLYNKNLYAYCDNNPVNRIDIDGYMWEFALAGGGAMVSGYGVSIGTIMATLSAFAPVALAVVTVAVAGLIAYDYIENNKAKNKTNKPKTVTKNSDLSTPASPKPPNNKRKGTIVPSKELYSKGSKDGFRIDVENPGTRPGQIHIHIYGAKYYYDIGRKIFVNCFGGPAAPSYVQKLLTDKKVIRAIEHGLTILGY